MQQKRALVQLVKGETGAYGNDEMCFRQLLLLPINPVILLVLTSLLNVSCCSSAAFKIEETLIFLTLRPKVSGFFFCDLKES